ncbi:hypothetical protein JCM14076_29270 [Methylosoma difficile]
MNSLQEKINEEINGLPLNSQKEVFDFVLFLKGKINAETDTEYLSKNADNKQAIIDGLNTPLSERSDQLEW